MWTFFHKLASPPHFYDLAAKFIPWFAVIGAICIGYGTIAGLFFAPADYQQGDAFRIIYVHVPSAYLSMMAYMIMAVSAAIGLIWRIKLSHAVAAAAAPLGRVVYVPGPDDRVNLGPTDVGYLVGVGRPAADFRAADAVPVLRLHGTQGRDRRHDKG